MHGEKRNAHRILVGKLHGRSRLEGLGIDGSPFKSILRAGWDDVDCINLADGMTSGGLLRTRQ
jgi:hypothetical protein